jgi:hypothetical protein
MLRRCGLWLKGNRARQQVERTRCRTYFAGGDPQIAGRSREAAVPKQQLNRADVGSGFEHVNGEGMPQSLLILLMIYSQRRFANGFNPFYGVEVKVIRHLRRIDDAILIVRLPGGAQVAVPDWMLNPRICDRFTDESEPRVSIYALFDLRRLIDAHCMGESPTDQSCAESPSGGTDAQQQKSVRVATQAALRRRRDLERATDIGKGTVPKSVAPSARQRSQGRQREAE